MSMNGHDPSKDPRNKLFGAFFERMERKKQEEAKRQALADAAAIEQDIKNAVEAIEDDGADNFTIGNQDGKVLMVFPKAVDWLGFSPEEAIIVAQALTENAAAALRWTPPDPPAQETPT